MICSLKKFTRLYNDNSVSVFGKKGRGKDMLTANIIARRRKKRYYISNVDYKLKNKIFIHIIATQFTKIQRYINFIF